MSGNDAHDERGRGPDAAADSDLSARLRRLETQLDRQRPAASDRDRRSEPSPSDPSALGRAFRLSTEFVAGIVAGGLIGWLCDRWVGTRPWGLIVFLMLGFAAGTFNVVRASGASASSSAGGKGRSKPQE